MATLCIVFKLFVLVMASKILFWYKPGTLIEVPMAALFIQFSVTTIIAPLVLECASAQS